MKLSDKEKTRELIKDMNLKQLYFVLRYVGRDRTFLCERQFGFIVHEATVLDKVAELEIEDIILGSESNHHQTYRNS